MYTLRPYQQEAVDKCLEFFADVKNKKNSIVVIPSAGGKSLVIAKVSLELGGDVLVFQPSKELLEQNYRKFTEYGGKASIFSASKNSKEVGAITFATIGSVKSKPELFKHFKYVIVDECHLVSPKATSMYSEFFEKLNVKIIGLTATPIRLKAYNFPDKHSKLGILTRQRPRSFADFLYVSQIGDLYREDYLTPCRYIDLDYDTSKLVVNSTGADYKEESMTEQFKSQGLLEKIKYGYLKAYKRKHILIFVTSIAEAHEVSEALPGCGVVSSKTPKKERAKLIADFKSGKLRGMVNVGVLTTGFDYPEIDMIIIARPTLSLAMYYQIVGRGIRLFDGKKDCIVFDLVGNHERFGSIEDLEIVNGYGGWAIYSKDKQITGVPLTLEEK